MVIVCYKMAYEIKLKNIKLSLFILLGLVVSSFAFYSIAQEKSNTQNNIFLDSDQDNLTDAEEKSYGTDPKNRDTDGDGYSDGAEVESGYNPLVPAPGDRLILSNTQNENGEVAGEETNNLTKQMADKISDLALNPDNENQEVPLEELQSIVDEALNYNTSEEDLPEINLEDIKIKKQNYGGLSEEKKKAKLKEDFENYITAVFYIMASNSPKPITSLSDTISIGMEITNDIANAISSGDSSSLDELSQSGEKMLEQLKDVEVPEDLVDIHIQAMRYAYYAQDMKNLVDKNNPDDPIKEIANLGKISAYIQSLTEFMSQVEDKFSQYGLVYDENIQKKLEDYGFDTVGVEDLFNTTTQETN